MARPEATGQKIAHAAGAAANATADDSEPEDDSEPPDGNKTTDGRLAFDWIEIDELRQIMGDCARSTVYEDPELQALAVRFAEPGRRTKRVRWLRHEAHALVKRRLKQRDAAAETVRQDIAARRERRRAKRRVAG
jgi:hypothetical protein